MTTSQTRSFLSELAAGHTGPSIPLSKRVYFQHRLRLRVFNFILEKFLEAQQSGLTKAALARRIEKTPDQINRWLGSPSNLTVDTMSDLLLGIASEEFELSTSSPIKQRQGNYSHYEELRAATNAYYSHNNLSTASATKATEVTSAEASSILVQGALGASIADYGQTLTASG